MEFLYIAPVMQALTQGGSSQCRQEREIAKYPRSSICNLATGFGLSRKAFQISLIWSVLKRNKLHRGDNLYSTPPLELSSSIKPPLKHVVLYYLIII